MYNLKHKGKVKKIYTGQNHITKLKPKTKMMLAHNQQSTNAYKQKVERECEFSPQTNLGLIPTLIGQLSNELRL